MATLITLRDRSSDRTAQIVVASSSVSRIGQVAVALANEFEGYTGHEDDCFQTFAQVNEAFETVLSSIEIV